MDKIAEIWNRVERSLFPYLNECLDEVTQKHHDLAVVLEVIRIEEHVPPSWMRWRGRPPKDRKALSRAFVAKALYNEPTNESMIERLKADKALRRICGFEKRSDIPSESTFSRAFAVFADSSLADRVHEALVKEYLEEEVVWHINRDSTEIDAREKSVKKAEYSPRPKHKRGRPKKGEERPKPKPNRIERQITQNYEEAISELPTACDKGAKKDSKGSNHYWIGYKLHVDVGDGGIPISAVTTSASVHDSQAAIPLAKMTASRVESFYDLMDSAYDAGLIWDHSKALGHVPIIDKNARKGKSEEMESDRKRRYNNRTTVERFNSQLKDNYGGRMVRVRGKPKVHAHLMFGVLVIFAQALLSLRS